MSRDRNRDRSPSRRDRRDMSRDRNRDRSPSRHDRRDTSRDRNRDRSPSRHDGRDTSRDGDRDRSPSRRDRRDMSRDRDRESERSDRSEYVATHSYSHMHKSTNSCFDHPVLSKHCTKCNMFHHYANECIREHKNSPKAVQTSDLLALNWRGL